MAIISLRYDTDDIDEVSLTGGLAEGFAAGFVGSGLSSSAGGPFLA